MRAKGWLIAAMLLSMTTLSSCALMPQEEEIRTAPVLQKSGRATYDLALVERGDLSVTEKLTCRYVPVRTENLSFAIGGEYLDRIMVQVGDAVQEGQVLAQLQLGDLEEQIEAVRSSIDELELRAVHLSASHGIEQRRRAVLDAQLNGAEQRKILLELEENQALEMQALEDELALKQLELKKLEEKLAERQIRAPFTGTITYIRSYKEGAVSVFGETSIKIADSTKSLFRAETEHWALLKPGDQYEIISGKNVHPVTVTSEAELGIAEADKKTGEKEYVYFLLNQADEIFEEGDFASLELVLEFREDTLHVPKDAVVPAGDKSIVYYQTEDGLRSYKEVETGIVASRRIEILSGLTEGELIIIS